MRRIKGAKENVFTMLMKSMFAMAVTVFMVAALSLTAYAASEGKIAVSSARVRKEADRNSEMIGSAMNGETVTIKAEVTGVDGEPWYHVEIKGGKTGYVLAELVEVKGATTEPTTTPTPTIPKTEVTKVQSVSGTVTGQLVRVREEATTKANVVTTVKKDEVLTILGTAVASDGATWYQVTFTTQTGEMNGFIREDFVDVNGELVPYVETPPTVTPDVQQPDDPVVDEQEEIKDYETSNADGTWYLIDNIAAVRYDIKKFITAADDNAKLYEKTLKTVKTQKGIIIVLVLFLVLAAAGIGLLVFKLKDMLDESFFAAGDRNPARNRPASQNKNVMHTVGNEKGAQPRPTGQPQQRPVGQPQQRPVGQPAARPAGQPQQRPAGQPQQRPAGQPQQRPAGQPQQRPVGQPAARPTGPSGTVGQPVARPTAPSGAVSQPQANPVAQPQPRPVEAKEEMPVNKQQNPSWQPKNFMTDEDEFEFEFLNWDGEENE